ncbi:16S rRNA (guanine(527)-N(7))-methyltransferase RsmG [Nitratireductor rhodophyticola]|uniref:16S rRNA (guanine(527)-N(7))-methyltransferase RsmG n=1 Tax=Nitratireductor rhodophyticola TaxID=2854036 RepID=UPI002AC8C69A|nr:16S rRNA (guanine(527)-N(7))-methyltransferase RsmG [Nitratireductor rhodophyticola]MEC9246048.1 16S rRNA (guanine(527)-N(7))-methyltransferase RsmG [Pseudomonadota bacterium]WPZ15393.1 16S rRNA (guanine(527)-N(7))-methyltransferase RsmG [Nitratireductor rhodophyticola]
MDSARFSRLLEISGPVSRETFDRLVAFEGIFRRWSRRINLAAPSTLNDLWERHILDSAQLLRLAPDALQWLDVGSGGGFPGAVMAILLAEKPGAEVHLVESNRKKAAFLVSALNEVGVAPRVHARRIEDTYDAIGAPDIVTARALAPLPLLIELTEPWLTQGARALFHKGRDYRREVEESGNTWRFDLVEHEDKVDAAAIILEVSNPLRR